jgi:hypothetical protein
MRVVSSFTSSSNSSSNNNNKDVAKATVPRGLRVLPHVSAAPPSSPQAERKELQQECQQLERWWQEPRWTHTKRIYSGE